MRARLTPVWACSSVVEHCVDIAGVASSILATPTIFQGPPRRFRCGGPLHLRLTRRMIAAYDEAMAKGLGAVTFEGKMIDVPVVERAKAVVRRAAQLRARGGAR